MTELQTKLQKKLDNHRDRLLTYIGEDLVITDIDGTIADCEGRLSYLREKPKNWEGFYSACSEDKPIWAVIDLLCLLALNGKRIVFLTGRPERLKNETWDWIVKHFSCVFGDEKTRKPLLLMRKNGDYRKDIVIKMELLERYHIDPEKVDFILEDRDQCVKGFREKGFNVFQVREGDY